MATPFEELEYLADFLPEDGEALVVSRQDGELHCEPLQQQSYREGISNPRFYGMLVQANEQLNALGTLPLWACGIGCFWFCVLMHVATGLGWTLWYLDVGAVLTAVLICYGWLKARQRWEYAARIAPVLRREIRRRQIDQYMLIGAVRQHPELRTLLDELVRGAGITAARGDSSVPVADN